MWRTVCMRNKKLAQLQLVAKMCKTLSRKNNLSCFKSLLVTGLWDIILTSLLPPIQSCSSKFWAWSCIASNFDKGWRGGHKHKIMDRPFKEQYSTVSQVLLELVVVWWAGSPFSYGRVTVLLSIWALCLAQPHQLGQGETIRACTNTFGLGKKVLFFSKYQHLLKLTQQGVWYFCPGEVFFIKIIGA